MQNNRFKVKQQILHNMLKIIQYPSDFEAFAPLIDITNNWNTELITTQLFRSMLRQVIRVLEHKWEWLTQDIYFQKIFQFYHDIFTKLKQNDICVNLMTLPCSLVVDPNTFTFKPIVAKTQMNMGVDEWIQWLKERNINLVYLYHCGILPNEEQSTLQFYVRAEYLPFKNILEKTPYNKLKYEEYTNQMLQLDCKEMIKQRAWERKAKNDQVVKQFEEYIDQLGLDKTKIKFSQELIDDLRMYGSIKSNTVFKTILTEMYIMQQWQEIEDHKGKNFPIFEVKDIGYAHSKRGIDKWLDQYINSQK